MLLTNLMDIKDKNYEILGIVEGSTVFSKHFGKDFMAGLKNVVGGEIKSYTEMIDDGKKQALLRLEEDAENKNADAVLNISYSITNMQQGSVLVVTVIGTAVKYL